MDPKSWKNSSTSQKGVVSRFNPQDERKKSSFVTLDSFSVSCITCWLLGPEIVRLALTGDSYIRKMLWQGGVSEFRATPRLSTFDTKMNLFWSSLRSFTGLRILKLGKTQFESIFRTLTSAHLAQLPSTLRTLETEYIFDVSDSQANRLPQNLENLTSLSCEMFIIPLNVEFQLPRTLQQLSCGYSSDLSRLILPHELNDLNLPIKNGKSVLEMAQITLPPSLEKLTWPFFSVVLWPEPTPIIPF